MSRLGTFYLTLDHLQNRLARGATVALFAVVCLAETPPAEVLQKLPRTRQGSSKRRMRLAWTR
jgi:hypothetical protein